MDTTQIKQPRGVYAITPHPRRAALRKGKDSWLQYLIPIRKKKQPVSQRLNQILYTNPR